MINMCLKSPKFLLYLTVIVVLHLKTLSVNAGNVLIHPLMGEGSHYMVVKAMSAELVSRGHNVTILALDRYEEKLTANDGYSLHFEFYKSNFTKAEYEELFSNMTNAGLRGKFTEWMINITRTNHMQRVASECQNLIGNTDLITKLQTDDYDLALVDGSFTCPIMQYLKIPYGVLMPASGLPGLTALNNRVPINPSYLPGFLTALDDKMTFLERLWNTAYTAFFFVLMSVFSGPIDELSSRYNISSEYFNDADLWILNAHFALDFPRPLLPHMVTVGGLTTKEPQSLHHVSLMQYHTCLWFKNTLSLHEYSWRKHLIIINLTI